MKPLFTLAVLALPAFAAFPNGYSYCKVVTTQHTMVSGTSDLANYPLTVILTDSDLRTTGNGGLVNNANGYDIGFYPDCSGSGTALKWELESYSATAGAIVAHVLRPTLSPSVNDTIGLYYGGGFSSFQSTASAVWDASYKAVWHLSNGTALNTNDSTSNGYHLTNVGSLQAAIGVIDGGTEKSDGSSQYLTNGSIATPDAITASFWTKILTSDVAHGVAALNFGNNFSTNPRLLAHVPYSDKTLYWDYGSTAGGRITADFTAYLDAWTHVALVYDPFRSPREAIYLNGSLVSTGNNVVGNPSLTGLFIDYAESSYDKRQLDEYRISDTGRSADWILTEYRNQSDPGTYISAGPRIGGASRVRRVVIGGV